MEIDTDEDCVLERVGEFVVERQFTDGSSSIGLQLKHLRNYFIKALRPRFNSSVTMRDRFKAEFDLQKQLTHPNIVKQVWFFAAGTAHCVNGDTILIDYQVQERCGRGQLFDLVVEKHKLPEQHCKVIFAQLLGAL